MRNFYKHKQLNLLYHRGPIFLRGLAYVLFKELGKILHVHYATVQRHRLNLKIGGGKQSAGPLHTLTGDILGEGYARIPFKHRGKIARADVLAFSQGVKSKICRKVGISKGYHLSDYW